MRYCLKSAKVIFLVGFSAIALPVMANVYDYPINPRTEFEPTLKAGEKAVVTPGQVMIEVEPVWYSEGIELGEEAVSADPKKPMTIHKGQVMVRTVPETSFYACQLFFEPPVLCLYDDEKDGLFESIGAGSLFSKARPLVKQIPYVAKSIKQRAKGSSFRQQYVFLGRSGSQIKVGYREFDNGMARPAFNEDLSVDVPETLPGLIAFKNFRVMIHAIDPTGLTYEIVK